MCRRNALLQALADHVTTTLGLHMHESSVPYTEHEHEHDSCSCDINMKMCSTHPEHCGTASSHKQGDNQQHEQQQSSSNIFSQVRITPLKEAWFWRARKLVTQRFTLSLAVIRGYMHPGMLLGLNSQAMLSTGCAAYLMLPVGGASATI